MKERLFKKAVKFVNFSFIGTTTFSMQLFFTVMLTEIFNFTYYLSHGVGLILAWTLNFMCNMKLTFNIKDKAQDRFAKFLLVAVAISVFNWVMVLLLVEFLDMHYFISIITVTFCLSIITFMTEEMWVFRKAKKIPVHHSIHQLHEHEHD